MKKVNSKTVRQGQTLWVVGFIFSKGWDTKYEVYPLFLTSKPNMDHLVGLANVGSLKTLLKLRYDDNPHVNHNMFFSRRRALSRAKQLNLKEGIKT